MKLFIGIVRDHSGSMSMLRYGAVKDFNETINTLKESSKKEKQTCVVTTVKCGVGDGYNQIDKSLVKLESIDRMQVSEYSAEGGTPLYDAVQMMIDNLTPAMKAYKKKCTALVMVITDGAENRSKLRASELSETIKKLQATDRWSFVFRVPKGYGKMLAQYLDLPMGNILEWETTEQGFEQATVINKTATASFMSNVSRGVFATKSFYQTDLSQVSSKEVRNKLENIKDKVKFWDVDGKAPLDIRGFCEYHLKRPMMKGAAFYQLTKTEKAIQDYKVIVIQNKVSGAVYAGAHAREILGLPYHGSAKVVPGDHGGFNVFVQSTSVNRKLVPGTVVLYWEQNQI